MATLTQCGAAAACRALATLRRTVQLRLAAGVKTPPLGLQNGLRLAISRLTRPRADASRERNEGNATMHISLDGGASIIGSRGMTALNERGRCVRSALTLACPLRMRIADTARLQRSRHERLTA